MNGVARPDWLSRRLFPFESRFLTVGHTRFHYVDEGQGPTLLFIHGGPMSSFMWRAQLGALRSRFRCVAVDIPGLGLSQSRLVRGAGFSTMADALRGFVHELGLERFTLVVHATGGPGGLAMAVRESARLDGLVISNSFAWPLTQVPEVRTMVRLVSSRVFSWLVVRFNLLARIAARRGRRHENFSSDERAAVLGPYESVDARAHLANLLYGLRSETAFFTWLGQNLPSLAAVPTLLLFGAEDNGYKAGFLERFRGALPRSESVVLTGAAHFITEDAPAEYTAALGNWLVARRPRLYSEAGLSSDTGLRSDIGLSSEIGPRS